MKTHEKTDEQAWQMFLKNCISNSPCCLSHRLTTVYCLSILYLAVVSPQWLCTMSLKTVYPQWLSTMSLYNVSTYRVSAICIIVHTVSQQYVSFSLSPSSVSFLKSSSVHLFSYNHSVSPLFFPIPKDSPVYLLLSFFYISLPYAFFLHFLQRVSSFYSTIFLTPPSSSQSLSLHFLYAIHTSPQSLSRHFLSSIFLTPLSSP